MTKMTKFDENYGKWISEISKRFRQSQIKASIRVNEEMLRFYWQLGKELYERKDKFFYYGQSFYKMVSRDLRKQLPDVKSFSETNLRYMQYFYETYPNAIKTEQIEEKFDNVQIHQQVVDNCKDGEKHRQNLSNFEIQQNRPQVGDECKDEDKRGYAEADFDNQEKNEQKQGNFYNVQNLPQVVEEFKNQETIEQKQEKLYNVQNRPQVVDECKDGEKWGITEANFERNQNLPQVGEEFKDDTKNATTTDDFGYLNNYQQVADDLDFGPIFRIPWGHQRFILDKCKGDPEKAIFFVNQVIKNNWSRAVLLNFLDTDLYERQGKAITNFKETLPGPFGDLAQEITKDPYKLDFIALKPGYDEKQLKDAIMDSIGKFLLELGNGFAFVGREYRIEIGRTENFIDMLFYHIKLRCYVVVEVKVNEFEPAYMGQLGTYVVAVNHQLKTEKDEKTLGLLVCKWKDDVKAQYALESSSQPLGVSAYELSQLVPKDLQDSLPSIEEIERELGKKMKD